MEIIVNLMNKVYAYHMYRRETAVYAAVLKASRTPAQDWATPDAGCLNNQLLGRVTITIIRNMFWAALN